MLRSWQKSCLSQAINFYKNEKHYFCLATPGAGKTVLAAEIAKVLLQKGDVDYVICLAPSKSVCEGIVQTFSRVLKNPFSGRLGSVGVAITYQSLLSGHHQLLADIIGNRVLVVLDEIHHCSGNEGVQGNAWGFQLVNQISGLATYTLSLSGTPWRTDGFPITFARYEDGCSQLSYHYEYGLRRAIQENNCRNPKVIALDVSRVSKKISSGSQHYSSIEEYLEDEENSYADLLNNEILITETLKRGVNKLAELRKKSPNSGGLVVASSYQHAQMIKSILESQFSQSAVLVSYKNDDALDKIAAFRHSENQWIVSIAMISEGVDIPRLQVCCHLSDIKTELYFRQVIGRIIRMTADQSRNCYFYTLAEKSLVSYAKRLEQEVPGSYYKERILEPLTDVALQSHANEQANSILDELLLPENIDVGVYCEHQAEEKVPENSNIEASMHSLLSSNAGFSSNSCLIRCSNACVGNCINFIN